MRPADTALGIFTCSAFPKTPRDITGRGLCGSTHTHTHTHTDRDIDREGERETVNTIVLQTVVNPDQTIQVHSK